MVRRDAIKITVLVAVAIAVALPDAAQAYHLQPYKWGKRTVVYHNDARMYRSEVKAAVRAWNGSGVRFRWKAGSRSRADVIIKIKRNLPYAGLAETRSSNGRALNATVYLRADLRKNGASPAEGQGIAVQVVVHELGHVLGLNHEDRRCAIMNSAVGIHCPRPKESWRYHCRAIERDDLRGAIKLYGGRQRALGAAVCPVEPAPPAPTEVAVLAGPTVTWRTPAGVKSIRVLRRANSCPTGPSDSDAEVVFQQSVKPGVVAQTPDWPPEVGRYCYAVFALGHYMRPSAAATVMLDYTGEAGAARPPTAAFDYYAGDPDDPRVIEFVSLSSDDGEIVSGVWDFGDGNTSTDPAPVHAYATGGSWTVTLTVTDDEGITGSVTETIHVGEPPG